ncbi:MAG: hypothetical protein ACRCU2_14735 [Planktothrix sp.]
MRSHRDCLNTDGLAIAGQSPQGRSRRLDRLPELIPNFIRDLTPRNKLSSPPQP